MRKPNFFIKSRGYWNGNNFENTRKKCYDKKNLKKKKLKRFLTKIIKMLKNANKKERKRTLFFCENCDFETLHKPNYERHLLTTKHISVTNANKMLTKKNEKEHQCYCGRVYKHKPSLLRHKKACNQEDNICFDVNKLDLVIKQNQEFKEMLLEQNRENKILQEKIMNMKNETIVNHFNLNVFLNETCKEALSITDFIKSLTIGLNELEYLGRNGYVDGIANIFLNGLRKLDVSKRPIHCSDAKREVLYIKDGAWEKDDEKIRITHAIKNIAKMNIRQLSHWTSKNPAHIDIKSNKNTDYLNIIKESVGYEEEEKNNKIIKLLSKETMIGKK